MSESLLNQSPEDHRLAEILASIKLQAGPSDRDSLMYACGFAAGIAARPLQPVPGTPVSRSRSRRWGSVGLVLASTAAAFLLGGIFGQHLNDSSTSLISPNAQQNAGQDEELAQRPVISSTTSHTEPSETPRSAETRITVDVIRPSEGVLYAGLRANSLAWMLANTPPVGHQAEKLPVGIQPVPGSASVPAEQGSVLRITDIGLSL